MTVYDLWVDGDFDDLSAISYAVVEKWISFALGKTTLNGYRIQHPTGRYASSIGRVRTGPRRVAVIADETLAPEARFLEEGHSEYDMKQLFGGRSLLLHRGNPGEYGSLGYGKPIVWSAPSARKRNVWAFPRAQGETGFKRVPAKITAKNARSWIIPPMPAYSPAQYLADMIRRGDFNRE